MFTDAKDVPTEGTALGSEAQQDLGPRFTVDAMLRCGISLPIVKGGCLIEHGEACEILRAHSLEQAALFRNALRLAFTMGEKFAIEGVNELIGREMESAEQHLGSLEPQQEQDNGAFYRRL